MAQIKEIPMPDGTVYKIAPVTVGQMRKIAQFRLEHPQASYMEDNVQCLVDCLNNANKAENKPLDWSVSKLDDLEFSVYRILLHASNRLNGFEEEKSGDNKKVGESGATPFLN